MKVNYGKSNFDEMRYIVVTGGVVSGLGKGITASSIGLILKAYGYRVTAIKIDPYFNVDSGTMSPYEHGECYVLDDGGETDLDLGNYERFLGVNMTKEHSLTSGKLYSKIIEKERRGDYLGRTVQLMPHVTDYIKKYIIDVSKVPVDESRQEPEICIIELGGTVGDHESGVYLEALSEFGKENTTMFVHVSLLPEVSGDVKTKPTQQSIRAIRSFGIDPDILILRCPRELEKDTMEKVSRMCKVSKDKILVNHNVSTIYEVPRLFYKSGIVGMMTKIMDEDRVNTVPDFVDYYDMLSVMYDNTNNKSVRIGIAGKYLNVQDTYLSLIRAIEHSGFASRVLPEIVWIDCEGEKEDIYRSIDGVDGVIIPGGFGDRGIEGMVSAASYCRLQKVPLFGICLGMQIMCIELDRNVLLHCNATSEEFNSSVEYKTVVLSDAKTEMGATMRLGSCTCRLTEGSLVSRVYGTDIINERHRHRYEISSRFVDELESKCDNIYRFTGKSISNRYMEVIEQTKNSDIDFWVGCQFHPEFKSRHNNPHPLFEKFVQTCIKRRNFIETKQ